MADFYRKPLARYPEPAYPPFNAHGVGEAASIGSIRRRIALGLVGTSVTLLASGCFGGALQGDMIGEWEGDNDHFLCAISDEQAKEVLQREFEKRGLTISEDYPIGNGDTIFLADGYDKRTEIGYEYQAHSEGDTLEYSLEEYLGKSVRTDGPYFLILDEYVCETYGGEEAAIDQLRADVESFFDALAEQGVL